MAVIRPPHFLLMHAFRHHLDVNIALNTFNCITHFITPVKDKIHMPYGHVLTAWLATQGIDITQGRVIPLTHSDRLSLKNFKLAGLRVVGPNVVWADGRAIPGDDQDAQDDPIGADEPVPAEEPAPARVPAPGAAPDLTFQERVFSYFEELRVDQQMVHSRLDTVYSRLDTMEQHQLEMMQMLRSMAPGASSATSRDPMPPAAPDRMDIGDSDDE